MTVYLEYRVFAKAKIFHVKAAKHLNIFQVLSSQIHSVLIKGLCFQISNLIVCCEELHFDITTSCFCSANITLTAGLMFELLVFVPVRVLTAQTRTVCSYQRTLFLPLQSVCPRVQIIVLQMGKSVCNRV